MNRDAYLRLRDDAWRSAEENPVVDPPRDVALAIVEVLLADQRRRDGEAPTGDLTT